MHVCIGTSWIHLCAFVRLTPPPSSSSSPSQRQSGYKKTVLTCFYAVHTVVNTLHRHTHKHTRAAATLSHTTAAALRWWRCCVSRPEGRPRCRPLNTWHTAAVGPEASVNQGPRRRLRAFIRRPPCGRRAPPRPWRSFHSRGRNARQRSPVTGSVVSSLYLQSEVNNLKNTQKVRVV